MNYNHVLYELDDQSNFNCVMSFAALAPPLISTGISKCYDQLIMFFMNNNNIYDQSNCVMSLAL